MPKLIILCGPPGSGKSTYAKNLIENDGDNGLDTRYINQDSQGKAGHTLAFESALHFKRDIILDRMNFSKEQRQKYLVPAKAAGYETEIRVLYQPRQVCFDRIVKREGHETIEANNPEIANKVLNFFFKNWERPTDDEADKVTHIYPEGNKIDCIISDIDNTLANASHREHYLNTKGKKKDWKSFFDAMDKDLVNDWCKDILYTNTCMYEFTREVILVSARPEDYRKITEKWLQDNHIRYDKLIMRQRNDFREDSIVKEQLMDFELLTKYNIIYWIDDRKKVIDKIRSRGIIVLDCAGEKGNF